MFCLISTITDLCFFKADIYDMRYLIWTITDGYLFLPNIGDNSWLYSPA